MQGVNTLVNILLYVGNGTIGHEHSTISFNVSKCADVSIDEVTAENYS
jgi:hypothetical protein